MLNKTGAGKQHPMRGANPVGVRTFAIAPGTNNAALVQQIQL